MPMTTMLEPKPRPHRFGIRLPIKWSTLKYWQSGDWENVYRRLQDLTKRGVQWNPGPDRVFAPLDVLALDRIRVVIVGQDPYPNPLFATGHAFSIPPHVISFPPTLAMMVKELQFDVPDFTFQNGDLTPWIKQGVLLWNPIPTCTSWRSLRHDWPEYEPLTQEVFGLMRHKVFCFLGAGALRYRKYVDENSNDIIWTSDPSPRGQIRGKNSFFGSRIFSTINAKLEEWKHGRIDWRL